mgnify:CR=1 FL=1
MSEQHNHHSHAPLPEGSKVKDPVCGMDVDPGTTEHHAEFRGTAYHFCSARCLARFEADPAGFVEEFRAYHAEVTPRGFFPMEEASSFRAWRR